MSRILATAAAEFRIGFRNRWVAIAMAMMVLFSMVLSAAGSAPSGALGADRLSVTVASLTSLSVYLVLAANWPLWLVVNVISVGLFVTKAMWLTALLYAVFAVLSIWGWKAWLRLCRQGPRRMQPSVAGG